MWQKGSDTAATRVGKGKCGGEESLKKGRGKEIRGLPARRMEGRLRGGVGFSAGGGKCAASEKRE